MAINGYGTVSGNSASNSASFLNGTVSATTSNDEITFSPVDASNETLTQSFYLVGRNEAVDVSTNHYIYFTIFMGYPEKDDALLYSGYSDSKNYYTLNSSSGGYGALDGLVSTLTSIEVL